MDEERANAGGLHARIQSWILRAFHLVATIERAAITPATYCHGLTRIDDDIVRAVGDELRIHAEHRGDRRLDLCRRVELHAEAANGGGNQCLKRWHIGHRGDADPHYDTVSLTLSIPSGLHRCAHAATLPVTIPSLV